MERARRTRRAVAYAIAGAAFGAAAVTMGEYVGIKHSSATFLSRLWTEMTSSFASSLALGSTYTKTSLSVDAKARDCEESLGSHHDSTASATIGITICSTSFGSKFASASPSSNAPSVAP